MWMVSLSLSAPALAADLPPRASERLEAAFEAVDATDPQREEIRTAIEGAAPSAASLRDEALALRDRMRALFGAEEIDRAAVEEVRLDAVDWFDRASALAVGTWVSVAEQLEPEQRTVLQEQRQQRLERIRRMIRGS